jgi:HD superfamily phosphodiesterase
MREELIKFMRNKNWHKKIAKTKPYTQSLFEHSLVVYDIIDSIIKLLNDASEKFSDKEKNILRISAILHDIGKEKAEWQEAVKKGQKPPSHIDEDLAKTAISDLKKHIKIEDEQTILRCIGLHHKAAQSAGNIIT